MFVEPSACVDKIVLQISSEQSIEESSEIYAQGTENCRKIILWDNLKERAAVNDKERLILQELD